MSKHVGISPEETADRLAIREPIEAYARCADRRDATGQMALFTTDTHFVVYMNAKEPKPSQELHFARGARSSLRGPEPVRCHDAFRWTEHNLHADGRSCHRGSVLFGASRHGGQWKATLDGRLAPLPRHFRKGRRGMALCRTAALRRLAGGASTVMNVSAAGQARLVSRCP